LANRSRYSPAKSIGAQEFSRTCKSTRRILPQIVLGSSQFDLIAQHDHDAIFWVRRRRGQRFGEPSIDAHTPRSELGHCKAGIVSASNDSDLAILDVLTREGSALRPRTADS
jgi:hypothetical protein